MRVIVTVLYSVGRMLRVLSKVSDTLALPPCLRFLVPLKMTLLIFSLRSCLVFCSPSTHRTASTILDLPQPLGPTMPITSSEKLMTLVSAKLLNPLICIDCRRMGAKIR